ncbi:MAG: fasciclin domain-containing protein [Pseudomonadota bacterium]
MRKSILALAAGLMMTVSTSAQSANIVETAEGAGVFNTLIAAAKAAGLAGALSSGGPLTVFAPTDEAFEKLPAGTVESLLKPENKDKLAAILKYHVLPRRLTSNMLPHKRIHVKTIKAGGDRLLAVTKSRGGVTVDGANVVNADIAADNGVIHVIDKVMLPSS